MHLLMNQLFYVFCPAKSASLHSDNTLLTVILRDLNPSMWQWRPEVKLIDWY
jgi:hypothetical protein